VSAASSVARVDLVAGRLNDAGDDRLNGSDGCVRARSDRGIGAGTISITI
jgi:hypothetical protein